MERTSYNPKTDKMTEYNGPDRRASTPQSVEVAVAKLSERFEALTISVKEDLKDFSATLDIWAKHTDAIQSQIEQNLQRQLDQNNTQHTEILDRSERNNDKIVNTFKEEIGSLIRQADRRLEVVEEAQRKVDTLQDVEITKVKKSIDGLETRIEVLEKAPDQKDAGLFRKVRDVAIGVAATAVAVAVVTWVATTITTQLDQIKDLQTPQKAIQTQGTNHE